MPRKEHNAAETVGTAAKVAFSTVSALTAAFSHFLPETRLTAIAAKLLKPVPKQAHPNCHLLIQPLE